MKIPSLLFTVLFTPMLTVAELSPPAEAANALGLDLYRLEGAKTPGNLLLSPYSIQSTLCMTLGGADGITKEEMARVLHLDGKSDAAPQELAALRQALEKAAETSAKQAAQAKKYGGNFEPLQLRVANRLFGRTGYPFHPDFLKSTETLWRAPLEAIDFGKAEAARTHINGWVEQQTEKRIRDLIPKGGVNEGTRLVLVNALYFKAAWAEEFRAQATKPLPFHAGGTTAVNVPTMYQQENFGYAKEQGFTAVTMPYTGRQLQFLVLLPDAKDGLAALEKSVSAAQLAKLSKLSTEREVQLYLPKFKIEPPTVALAEHLQSLGMKTAFDVPPGSADFSRMAPRTPQEYLFISAVFHKTFLALDEKGTEAAAATAVAMAGASAAPQEKPKPVEVRVDHPFLFAIQHRESGLCLFLGRVTDPR